MAGEFWLSEDQFGRLAPLLPTDTRAWRGSMTGVYTTPLVKTKKYARDFIPPAITFKIDVTTSSCYIGLMFEFSAGSPSLCLVDTVRNRGGADIERLATPKDFTCWLREASLIEPDSEEGTEADLADARSLRDALYRSALALADGSAPSAVDVDLINVLARRTPPRPQWVAGRVTHIAERGVRAAIGMLAGDAVATLADAQANRVRLCPECRMMFVDKSPAGKRRWCSSTSGCGNRAKVREHRARRSQKGSVE